jgi:hypothetical protein
MADGRRRIDIQDLLVSHADADRFSAVQAYGVELDLTARK